MRVPMRDTGAEQPVVAVKSRKRDGAKGLRHLARTEGQPCKREEPKGQAKPYQISKRAVWEAYKRVKANKGTAGVDEESIEEFEQNLRDNLYRLWNRMSSGSYFPPPVRMVAIPKKSGGERNLGIPTVSEALVLSRSLLDRPTTQAAPDVTRRALELRNGLRLSSPIALPWCAQRRASCSVMTRTSRDNRAAPTTDVAAPLCVDRRTREVHQRRLGKRLRLRSNQRLTREAGSEANRTNKNA